MYMAIHIPRPNNVHQTLGAVQVPKAMLQSMCCKPSKVLICLICHSRCMRMCQYAADMSDLKSHAWGWPCQEKTAQRVEPKSWRPSNLILELVHVMKLLRVCSLALWSVMRQRSEECGFGTTPIGILCMPGKRSSPKASENLSSFISSLHCLRANSKF